MLRFSHVESILRPVVLVALLLVPAAAAEPNEEAGGKAKPPGAKAELFAGMEDGRIEVELIAKDTSKARLLITNKTDRPLTVELPAALAAVPVLAQFPDPFAQDNAPQMIGGGPQGPFGPGGPMNFPMQNQGQQNPIFPGFQFNIPPEKVGKLKLTTVCLEYGKPNPKPQVKYEVKPIESVTKRPGVAKICARLSRGELDQRVAQLAAWHLNNDMSWEELGKLRKRVSLGKVPRYSRKEISAAKKAAEEATKTVKKRGSKSTS